MKRLFCVACLVIALPASASLLELNVPTGQVTDGTELCEELRIQMRATTASWSLKVCAEEFLRRGMREFKKDSVKRAATHQMQDDLVTERDAFDLRFPVETPVTGRPDPPNIMRCGDGEVEVDATIPYSEGCDDGNVEPGDGCDENCQTE